jgi:hypothetical protein
MRGVAITVGVLTLIVLAPVAVYLLRSGSDGTHLRATVGRCSPVERDQHPVACAFIDAHPAIEVVGPIDETGGGFSNTFYRAGADRRIEIRLASGRYNVLLEIPGRGTIASNVPLDLDLSTGDRDLRTVVPAEPWMYEGVPGA